ncbi:MAG: zinc ribbon domain-containing protein [Gemmatimonadales bacterium]|nr:MAG: zinc ribbon domain-containing protein [Gemmatimonadales bacterium]
MPLFEYVCQTCEHEFEALVLGSSTPSCPACGSENLERQISRPAIKSDNTRALAMKAAKKRDQRLGSDRMHERIEYEASHDD